MKVILMDDIERVGHEGDVLEVADGYARNYLMPKGLAVQATKGALKDLETRRRAIASRESDKRAKAQKTADALSAKRVVVMARAGEGQRIHGQVTTQMIADAVKEQIGMEIDKRDIDVTEPIRELGDYLISTRLYKDVAAQLPVSVVRDGESEEAFLAAQQAPPPVEEAPQEAAEEASEADAAEAGEEE